MPHLKVEHNCQPGADPSYPSDSGGSPGQRPGPAGLDRADHALFCSQGQGRKGESGCHLVDGVHAEQQPGEADGQGQQQGQAVGQGQQPRRGEEPGEEAGEDGGDCGVA